MLIGLDIRSIQAQDSYYRGIGEFGRNFLQSLLSIDHHNKYILFCNKKNSSFDLPSRAELFYLRRLPRLSWIQDQIFLPPEILLKKIDLFHSLTLNLPFIKTNKIVVTIHDIIPFLFPEDYLLTTSFKFWYHRQLKYLPHADRIIVNSHSTQNDLMKFIGIDPEKIKVIYYGINPVYNSPASEGEWLITKNKFKINKEYVLYVGGLDARKNIPFLLSVFKDLRQHTDIMLVLVGAYRKEYSYVFDLVKELGLQNEVIFTGFIETTKLHLLYSFSKALVFPSLYEGFGLPLVEAMASGCPVVAFNGDSAAEIVQNAAVLVEKNDKKSFIKSIIDIIQNTSFRAELINNGLKRAKDFSWEKAAEETIKTYQEVISD